MSLEQELRPLADEQDFSGVVAVSLAGDRLAELARGFADRANERPIDMATRFGTASVTKGLTALTAASLIESGELHAETTLRSLLPDALPLVDPTVTIEHLLGHTSGVGDYLDEEALADVDEYVMSVPVHLLDAPSMFLPALDGHPQKSAPGSRFAYNNGGFVMLSIAVERATGRSFFDLVQERVLDPAGMADSGFERSDRLPAGAAIGYLEDGRSNVLHLPVRGAGDGGAYSTVSDLEALWTALFAGRIVSKAMVEWLVAPRSDVPEARRRYGLGFWLRPDRDTVMLEGMDAGVSARTAYDRPSGLKYTVLSNTSSGAWPIVRHLEARLPDLAGTSPAEIAQAETK
jgi:CubicO group peptidase (beta-lactamase class C family)